MKTIHCLLRLSCSKKQIEANAMIDAAILIPVYRSKNGELHIVMILRNPGGGKKLGSENFFLDDVQIRR